MQAQDATERRGQATLTFSRTARSPQNSSRTASFESGPFYKPRLFHEKELTLALGGYNSEFYNGCSAIHGCLLASIADFGRFEDERDAERCVDEAWMRSGINMTKRLDVKDAPESVIGNENQGELEKRRRQDSEKG
ncbi:hypothetical protein FGRMN_10298 [Fusarium graminum]|nr:hypothetical protein FGRMN_10298 [Fusarium graminum]